MSHISFKDLPADQRPFEARGAAKKLWVCRDEEILIEGPAGTGKTRAILEKIHFCAMKYKGMRGLLVRKTRESMTETVLEIFEDKVIPLNSSVLDGPTRKFRQAYLYPNGSKIIVAGMDKATRIMSGEYDIAGCFETTELTEEDFENITTRLRNGIMPYQQIVADCNPDVPHHWLNKRPVKVGMTRLMSKHQDNPALHDGHVFTPSGEKYINKLKRLTGARYTRLFKGEWVAAEGMVYEDWDTNVHLISRFDPPKDWRRLRVVDFGFKAPFVCQWWAIDKDDRAFRYREIYKTQRTVTDHAKMIVALSRHETIDTTICDHDAEGRANLEREGIPTVAAYKDIETGIQQVQLRLRRDETGRPSIFYMRDSVVERDTELEEAGLPTSTEEEYDGYVWKKDVSGKPIKEEPVGVNDHGLDATRYFVSHVDNLAGFMFDVRAAEASAVS